MDTYKPQTLDIEVGKVIQHKPHVTTDHRVCACAWDRAAHKAKIRPEFSLSAPPTDGVGLETSSCELFLVACSLQQKARLSVLHRDKDHCDPRPAEKAALLFPCPAGWWEAEVRARLSCPQLVPHSGCSSSSEHSEGKTL